VPTRQQVLQIVLEWFDDRAGRPHTDDDLNDLRARYDAIPEVDPGDRQVAATPSVSLWHTHPHLVSDGVDGHAHPAGDQPHRHAGT
jgi:hypothetical protein